MEALGWQVGAPRAAERLTTVTVLLVSDVGPQSRAGQPSVACWRERPARKLKVNNAGVPK